MGQLRNNFPFLRYCLFEKTGCALGFETSDSRPTPQLGQFLPYTDLAVLRTRWNMNRWSTVKDTQLFNIESDPGQQHNLTGSDIESKYIELLRQTMQKMDAPAGQYERLGLN